MASVEAVARENGQVIEALADDGIAVFPADDAHAPLWQQLAGRRRLLRFAVRGEAEISALAAWSDDHWSMLLDTPIGPAPVRLRAAGAHNLHNALAAAACALGAGCPLEPIREGLQGFEPVKGRSQLKRFVRAGRQVSLVDDSYNANPDSVRAAIDVLAALPRPRWLVLGDMGEVGDQGPAFHAEVGAYALQRGIESFWCAGELMRHAADAFGAGARHHESVEALLAGLPQAPAYHSVLVKGSRFMRMERVVAALMQGSEYAA
jgi:UDP-N-acetylmuramoyl-tripeptide--D-alanyl-D-alanine ligase